MSTNYWLTRQWIDSVDAAIDELQEQAHVPAELSSDGTIDITENGEQSFSLSVNVATARGVKGNGKTGSPVELDIPGLPAAV